MKVKIVNKNGSFQNSIVFTKYQLRFVNKANYGLFEELVLDYNDELTEDIVEKINKLRSTDLLTNIYIDNVNFKMKGIDHITNSSNIKRLFIYGGVYE